MAMDSDRPRRKSRFMTSCNRKDEEKGTAMTNDLEPNAFDTSSPMRRAPIHDSNWRDSKWFTVAELLLAALIFAAAAWHRLPLGRGPWLLALGWASLHFRQIGWRGVGMQWYRSWATTLKVGLCCGVLLELFELVVRRPVLERLIGKQADLSQFHDLIGNPASTALYILLVWAVAAFGAEMIYRGHLMNRVSDLLNRTRTSWIFSLIVVHVVFGMARSYRGIVRLVDEGVMGALLSLVYMLTGRNLAAPIVAHGFQGTIDMILIFTGRYPGS